MKSIHGKLLFGFVLACLGLNFQGARAAGLNFSDLPLSVSQQLPPMVMLNVSRDHQLFYKAYNDYSDLDGDGTVETTYKHSFDYYGYFDSYKCYSYSSGMFVPASLTTDKYCTGNWSGNFLNWASMARVDVMRKVLYGGKRSTDADMTVLERSNIPTDAHAWAKYYSGADINKLTPFNGVSSSSPIVSGSSVKVDGVSSSGAVSSLNVGSTANAGLFKIGDQVKVTSGTTKTSYGQVGSVSSTTVSLSNATKGSGSSNFSTSDSIVVENLSRRGITLCNATIASSTAKSETTASAPLIRVAYGDYSLWNANERWQCYWRSEKDGSNNPNSDGSNPEATNGNGYVVSGLTASRRNPAITDNSINGDYIARVKVCDSSLVGKENCKQYGSSYKPAGLLQNYGEIISTSGKPKIYFGLITGTYSKNKSGGVLRKNVGKAIAGNSSSSDDEIDASTGRLTSNFGIIKTLDALRIVGYEYSTGTYFQSGSSDTCTWQMTSFDEGKCVSWGNPLSEMFMESVRYFSGKSPTSSFGGTLTKDALLGLGVSASWTDPVNETNYCSPLNVLVFNASVSSYDDDLVQTGFSSVFGSGSTVAEQTSNVGAGEGINGRQVLIGQTVASSSLDGVCSPKTLSNLGDALGICPEAPSLKGSYQIAGAAYYAHTHRIRNDITAVPTTDKNSLKLNTYGVQLATNVPRVKVKVGTGYVTIQPAYRLDLGSGKVGTGTIVDFKIISQTDTSGLLYVNWEDSNQGGDYDQDVNGYIKYVVNGQNITVTTKLLSESTNQPQGFGYVISGTTKDGPHFHSGIESFNFTDPYPGVLGCSNCKVTDAETSVTYTLGASSALALENPLYYAAKWGGFKDGDGDQKPLLVSEWDSKKVDGSSGTDGLPDNYFYVNNPGALEQALGTAFSNIANAASSSGVGSSSANLTVGTTLYQGLFSSADWTGDLRAYSLNSTTLAQTLMWSAKSNLESPDYNARTVISYDPASQKGIAFTTGAGGLTSVQKALIQGSVTDAAYTQKLVDYIRGSSVNEGSGAGSFRARPSKLGDIVNSSPVFVGYPAGQYNKSRFVASYDTIEHQYFLESKVSRDKMIYVGANDGMLHGFSSSDGKEKLAYVPSSLIGKLGNLANQSYAHSFYVDGSPEVADVEVSNASGGKDWKTYLVSGLRSGGRGLFALDVTDPSQFSQTNAASLSLWEFGPEIHKDIGRIFGSPLIVKLSNGKWAALVGNGYHSTADFSEPDATRPTGEAKMFLIYLQRNGASWSASDYVVFPTGIGSSTSPNGMSGVAAIDMDLDGYVDYAYAGDLKGNMWRFDLRDMSAAMASPSSMVTKLFVACSSVPSGSDACPASDLQPITGVPLPWKHPKSTKQTLVFFGTGKYIEATDGQISAGAQKQSFYGIWDKMDGLNQTVKRNELLTQMITDGTSGRMVTNTPIDWSVHKGWAESLPMNGELVTGSPTVVNGILVYGTFAPSSIACDFGGKSYLMGVNYTNGGLLSDVVFDTNGDGEVNSSDSVVAGVAITASPGGVKVLGAGDASGKGVVVFNPAVIDGGDTTSGGSSSSSSSGGTSSGSSSSGGTSSGGTVGSSSGGTGPTPADLSKGPIGKVPGQFGFPRGIRISWRELRVE